MPKTKIIDGKVIKSIVDGDVFAFKILYHFYYPKVYTFIERHIRASQDSEELTQDLFIKIWKNRAAIDPTKPIDGYIFKIAKNCLIDYYRRKKSLYVSLDEINEAPYQDVDPESQLYNKELTALVDQIIEALPEKRKKIYLLSRKEGLTYLQIANKLGISVKTVETQISLALKAIKQNLKCHTDIIIVCMLLFNFF